MPGVCNWRFLNSFIFSLCLSFVVNRLGPASHESGGVTLFLGVVYAPLSPRPPVTAIIDSFSLSPPFLLSPHISTLCSFLHFGPLPPFPSTYFFFSFPQSLPPAHLLFLPTPHFLVPLSQLQPSFIFFHCSLARTITASPSLPPSLRLLGISLLAQFTQPTHFMGLIPFFSLCVYRFGGMYWFASLCFSHHFASSLSLLAPPRSLITFSLFSLFIHPLDSLFPPPI